VYKLSVSLMSNALLGLNILTARCCHVVSEYRTQKINWYEWG